MKFYLVSDCVGEADFFMAQDEAQVIEMVKRYNVIVKCDHYSITLDTTWDKSVKGINVFIFNQYGMDTDRNHFDIRVLEVPFNKWIKRIRSYVEKEISYYPTIVTPSTLGL